ncbi:hypothetical protein CYY_000388 [Polysphondylium violaceum]|uniref:Glutaredoxin-like protein n=1 Tax=Polysphondylium violaceum TaxID=133409 RepID=A0A8J4QB01_9MYCE|nr:hypothetical protein CYY_000388 [Polysphondylium violaceum]
MNKSVNKIRPIVIKFFTRPACSLCVDAKEIMYPAIEDVGKDSFKVDEIDIDKQENKEYFDRFKFDVPVAMIDKKVLFKHRIDEDKLYYDLESAIKGDD